MIRNTTRAEHLEWDESVHANPLGIALMGAGGWLAVLGAERVVDLLDVEGSVIGLTLVALATTSEFVALIPAALRPWHP